MYYEFYIDQFFVQQFVIGCLLLAAATGISGAHLRWRRVALGSLINASCVTVCILIGSPWLWPSGLIGAVLAAFRGNWRHLRNGAFSLLIVTIFFGGALEALLTVLPVSFTVAASGAFVLLLQVQKAVTKIPSKAWKLTEVTICQNGAKIELVGLWDTGNQLREPMTGRPVSIADAQALKPLLEEGWEEKRGFCLIPYHSLGDSDGWIRGVIFDEMCVKPMRSAQGSLEKTHPRSDRRQNGLHIPVCFTHSSPVNSSKVIHHPVIALYDGNVSTHGEYQIILHPDHAP